MGIANIRSDRRQKRPQPTPYINLGSDRTSGRMGGENDASPDDKALVAIKTLPRKSHTISLQRSPTCWLEHSTHQRNRDMKELD